MPRARQTTIGGYAISFLSTKQFTRQSTRYFAVSWELKASYSLLVPVPEQRSLNSANPIRVGGFWAWIRQKLCWITQWKRSRPQDLLNESFSLMDLSRISRLAKCSMAQPRR